MYMLNVSFSLREFRNQFLKSAGQLKFLNRFLVHLTGYSKLQSSSFNIIILFHLGGLVTEVMFVDTVINYAHIEMCLLYTYILPLCHEIRMTLFMCKGVYRLLVLSATIVLINIESFV